MTPAEEEQYINRTLRYMEQVRELSYEAESEAERKRLDKEYSLMWKAIEPLIDKRKNHQHP